MTSVQGSVSFTSLFLRSFIGRYALIQQLRRILALQGSFRLVANKMADTSPHISSLLALCVVFLVSIFINRFFTTATTRKPFRVVLYLKKTFWIWLNAYVC